MKIKLPCFGIVVTAPTKTGKGAMISSDLLEGLVAGSEISAAVNALESLILAHACAGVRICAPDYIEGIETAVNKIFEEYT